MSTFDLLPDLAAQLESLVPPEPGPGDWSDVLRRAAPIRRSSRTSPTRRLVVLVVALLLLLVAVASATYLLLHDERAPRPHSGALTVTAGGYNARWPVKIIEVLPGGRTVVVWRCPAGVSCGEPEGIDWSSRRPSRRVHDRCVQWGQRLLPWVAHPRHRYRSRYSAARGARAALGLPLACRRCLVAGRQDARLRLFSVPGEITDLARRGGRFAPPSASDRRPRCELAELVARRNPTSRSWLREAASAMGSTSSTAMAWACAAWSRMVRRPIGLRTAE